jgi:hypothetical protein
MYTQEACVCMCLHIRPSLSHTHTPPSKCKQKVSDGSKFCMKFDLLHVVPPMSAPDFIAKSPLANKEVHFMYLLVYMCMK